MKIILFQPQIPQNTGNIVRTCAVAGCELIMITPLGFSTQDRWLKRAGLDYWEGVCVSFMNEQEFEVYLEKTTSPFYFFSSKADKFYTSVSYQADSHLIFGSETNGLPDYLSKRWPDHFVKLPMKPDVRCLNLATSVGIGLYEAWRQLGFH